MRNFHSRLTRLEQVHNASKPRCLTCGYPQRAARSIYHAKHERPLDRCKACDQPLDDKGIPLKTPCVIIRRGTRHFDVNSRARL